MKFTQITLRDGDRYSFVTEWDGKFFINLIIGRLIDVDQILHYSKSKLDLFLNIYYLKPVDLKWQSSKYCNTDLEYSPFAKESKELTPWDEINYNVDPIELFAFALNQSKIRKKVLNTAKTNILGSWSNGIIGMNFFSNDDFKYFIENKERANEPLYRGFYGLDCNKYKFGPWQLFYFNDEKEKGIKTIVIDVREDKLTFGGLGSGLCFQLHRNG